MLIISVKFEVAIITRFAYFVKDTGGNVKHIDL
jgi:hypothetical protein